MGTPLVETALNCYLHIVQSASWLSSIANEDSRQACGLKPTGVKDRQVAAGIAV